MKYYSFLFLLSFFLIGCGSAKKIGESDIKLTFLDDYVIPSDLEVGGTRVGGLSGIEYMDEKYLLVCDHPGNPRFYITKIQLDNKKIDTVIFSEVIEINRKDPFLKDHTLDLEGIRYDEETGEVIISSEGSIQNEKEPSVFKIDMDGNFISHYQIPAYFDAEGEQKPRNNGVFEGLSQSVNDSGIWVGTELPLEKDGSKAKLFPTKSPVRITKFNNSGEPVFQFVMQLEEITKIPWLYFAINGLTEIIEYAPQQFLVLERAFSAGHGSHGNTVRVFDVDARKATNTLNFENLKKAEFSTAKKVLIFDFKSVEDQLEQEIVDNIEGMTFGPSLPNGNKTFLLTSDNNFNSLGKQINQIILMEVEMKKIMKK